MAVMFYAVTPRLCVPSLAMRVLVVEDDLPTRKALVHLLTLAGFQTLAASTLSGATEQLMHQPDIVLTDLTLPDGCGLSLIRKVRERDASVAIAVVSGADDALLNDAAATRPDAIFRKPLNVEQLMAWLNTACPERR